MNQFYVYILFRPWNGQPCYVGKGKGLRSSYHRQVNVRHPNKHLASVFKKAGGDLPLVFLHEGLPETKAFEYETALIKAIGRADKGLGPLCNRTDGGEGETGQVLSQARKDYIGACASKALKGRPKTPEHIEAARRAKTGITTGPMPEAQKLAIKSALKGRTRAPREIAALQAAADRMTDEARASKSSKISAALTGKPLSDEHKKKISEFQRGRPRSEEFKQKVRAGMKRYREEVRRAMFDG